MIKEMDSLAIAEAKDIFVKSKSEKDLGKYFKKFEKLKLDDVKKLREELEKAEILKVKSTNITKIIDNLPRDAEDLNKIFVDVSLDKDEIDKILGIVKRYK